MQHLRPEKLQRERCVGRGVSVFRVQFAADIQSTNRGILSCADLFRSSGDILETIGE